jgi:hypothetical protein
MQEQDQGGQGKPSPRGLSALAQIAQALGTHEARTQFRSDPRATIKGYDELPESVRTGLESLSEHELVVLARAHRMFDEAGYNHEIEDDFGGGRVSFF